VIVTGLAALFELCASGSVAACPLANARALANKSRATIPLCKRLASNCFPSLRI
jgi:hypothetical protein